MRAGRGFEIPARTRTLGSGIAAMVVTRPQANTLVVSCATGFLDLPLDGLLRHPTKPWKVGEGVTVSDGSILVSRLGADGRPVEVEFRSLKPRESEDYVWVVWSLNEYRRFVLPKVGGRVDLPAVILGDLMSEASF